MRLRHEQDIMAQAKNESAYRELLGCEVNPQTFGVILILFEWLNHQ